MSTVHNPVIAASARYNLVNGSWVGSSHPFLRPHTRNTRLTEFCVEVQSQVSHETGTHRRPRAGSIDSRIPTNGEILIFIYEVCSKIKNAKYLYNIKYIYNSLSDNYLNLYFIFCLQHNKRNCHKTVKPEKRLTFLSQTSVASRLNYVMTSSVMFFSARLFFG